MVRGPEGGYGTERGGWCVDQLVSCAGEAASAGGKRGRSVGGVERRGACADGQGAARKGGGGRVDDPWSACGEGRQCGKAHVDTSGGTDTRCLQPGKVRRSKAVVGDGTAGRRHP